MRANKNSVQLDRFQRCMPSSDHAYKRAMDRKWTGVLLINQNQIYSLIEEVSKYP